MATSPERSSTTPSSTADEAEATTNYFAVKEVNTGPRESSFSYSFQYPSSTRGNPFARGSIIDRSIVAVPEEVALEINAKRRKAPQYNGRIKRWRGAMLLFIVIVIAAGAITYFSLQSNTAAAKRRREVQQRIADRARIESGLENPDLPGSKNDEESEDGVVNNPKVYKAMGCELPNYVSKQGKIWAVSKNGTEVPISIKGVNWFGMETGMQAPFGLWDNEQNGTTVYAIADFLQKNKFNSVRVPLCVQNILENKPLEANIVNRVTNRALDLSSYMSLLQSIVKGLGYRRVSVLISMHTLDRMNAAGSLWYGKGFTEKDFFNAIDMLTKALCSDEYWNVLGIDVKNEPWEGTWGTGLANDFKVGAEKIANRMLQGCPKWMAFVEGVNAQHTIVLDEQEFGYYDWFGGGLHKAKDFPPKFSIDNKLVYAPHYYTPAVFPQYYLYGGGTVGKGNVITDYIELTTAKLYGRVKNTMYDMFGFLVEDKGPAVLLGEFGGLYTYDTHPQKTTQRCTDSTVRVIVEEGYAGGYMWSLNPESAYQYNPADTAGNFVEGLLQIDWRKANAPFLKAMQGLDKLTDLKPMPCFPIEIP